MRLYSYWRSTAAFRVRAALNLKGLSHQIVPVNLLEGAQYGPAHGALDPSHSVPVLKLTDGTVLTQSMAILEWLEEVHPTPPLLPVDPTKRARVRAAAQVLASDVHPINNLRVVQRLQSMGHSDETVLCWMRDWTARGFTAFQSFCQQKTLFSFGDTPSHADLCLSGQLINARRWGVDMGPFSRLDEIDAACLAMPEITAALPQNQPDAVSEGK